MIRFMPRQLQLAAAGVVRAHPDSVEALVQGGTARGLKIGIRVREKLLAARPETLVHVADAMTTLELRFANTYVADPDVDLSRNAVFVLARRPEFVEPERFWPVVSGNYAWNLGEQAAEVLVRSGKAASLGPWKSHAIVQRKHGAAESASFMLVEAEKRMAKTGISVTDVRSALDCRGTQLEAVLDTVVLGSLLQRLGFGPLTPKTSLRRCINARQ